LCKRGTVQDTKKKTGQLSGKVGKICRREKIAVKILVGRKRIQAKEGGWIKGMVHVKTIKEVEQRTSR